MPSIVSVEFGAHAVVRSTLEMVRFGTTITAARIVPVHGDCSDFAMRIAYVAEAEPDMPPASVPLRPVSLSTVTPVGVAVTVHVARSAGDLHDRSRIHRTIFWLTQAAARAATVARGDLGPMNMTRTPVSGPSTKLRRLGRTSPGSVKTNR